MKKLFMVYLGGKAPAAATEIHDVVFAVGETLEACEAQLRQQWFGSPEGLHIDSYRPVHHVKGYDIVLEEGPFASSADSEENGLYFVQMGGYTQGIFGEIHLYDLVVAPSVEKAREYAKAQFFKEVYLPHVDKCFDIDAVVKLETIHHMRISLVKNDKGAQDDIVNLYKVI